MCEELLRSGRNGPSSQRSTDGSFQVQLCQQVCAGTAPLWGILNAATSGITNGGSEAVNARIQRVKRMACGFRNKFRFRAAILFHLGSLDLYPEAPHASQTKA